MKRLTILLSVLGCLTLPAFLAGCDRTVSHTKTVETDDGKIKTKEKTVTQNPDGTITTTEQRTTSRP